MGVFDVLDLMLSWAFWPPALVGLLGAWAAWTYLPETIDRGSISALIFVVAVIVGFVLSWNEKKSDDV